MKNISLTDAFHNYCKTINNILFNPSIVLIRDDYFLISVRSFQNDISNPNDTNPNLHENKQHPWTSNWKGIDGKREDSTYLFIAKYEHDNIVIQEIVPTVLEYQDARLFRFDETSTHVTCIMTYNKSFHGNDIVIDQGATCDAWCYIIGFAYLIINKRDFSVRIFESQEPMCPNISNMIEKNWSLWRYNTKLIHLIASYSLVPHHKAFSVKLESITNDTLKANSMCDMFNLKTSKPTFLERLEDFYDKNLHVSLSTPAYPVKKNIYQAVGHIKVKRDYIMALDDSSGLGKFAKKYMDETTNVVFHERFVYFMFIYQFEVQKTKTEPYEIPKISDAVQLPLEEFGVTERFTIEISKVSPAFIIEPDKYKYFLNFPAGQVILDNGHTLISYGNGDFTSHVLDISKKEMDDMLFDITPRTNERTFKFLRLDDN